VAKIDVENIQERTLGSATEETVDADGDQTSSTLLTSALEHPRSEQISVRTGHSVDTDQPRSPKAPCVRSCPGLPPDAIGSMRGVMRRPWSQKTVQPQPSQNATAPASLIQGVGH
jgi:hypothetical protein